MEGERRSVDVSVLEKMNVTQIECTFAQMNRKNEEYQNMKRTRALRNACIYRSLFEDVRLIPLGCMARVFDESAKFKLEFKC